MIRLAILAKAWNLISMEDQLLASTDIEEALSVIYASAVASSAGYVVAYRHFDRDSIDLTIEAGNKFRPKLDLQLKASIGVDDSADEMIYFCKKKNYDDLRVPTQVPRILVVLRLPKDATRWLDIGKDELVLRHCAYWLSLHGYPESENATGKTVYIPTANRFDAAGLKALMEQSRSGKIV